MPERWIILLCLILSGCSRLAFWSALPKTPETKVTTPTGANVTMTGDAKTPSKVDTNVTVSSLQLPSGQNIRFNASLGTYDFTLSQPTTIETKATNTKVEGGIAYDPPKAPTLSEVKTETRKTWLYIAGFIGCAAALYGLIKDWHVVMVGGLCVAGAAVVGITISDYPWILPVICVAAGFAVAGPYIWHVLGHKNLTPTTK